MSSRKLATRERTTWSRRTAEDPRAMNQDHLSQQPAFDEYAQGSPSTWAEDVRTPNRWEDEYSGDIVKRNEIGMPAYRSETFSHPEKTAYSLKKAKVCLKIASAVLGESTNEDSQTDCATGLMHLPDHALLKVYEKFADEIQAEGQTDQLREQAMDALSTGDLKTARAILKSAEDCQGSEQDQEQQQSQDQGPAQATQSQEKQAAMLARVAKAAADAAVRSFLKANQTQQQAQQQQVSQTQQQAQQQQAQQQQAQQQQVSQAQQQAQQQLQQAQQQLQQAQQQLQQAQQQQVADFSDPDLADPMMGDEPDVLFEEQGMGLEDDEFTRAMFAQDEQTEFEQEQEQEQAPAQAAQQKAARNRTASTRTVGTRPDGVARIGGGIRQSSPSERSKISAEIKSLEKLWKSAPQLPTENWD